MVFLRITVRFLLIGGAVAGFWQALVSLMALPPYIVPGPVVVARALADNAVFLAGHALTTLGEILIGLAVGIIAGIITALLMSLFLPVRRLLFPVIVMSQALPVFAIAPLLVLWLGYGLASKVTMVAPSLA